MFRAAFVVFLTGLICSPSWAVSGSGVAPWVGLDLQGFPCKGSTGGFGPFDYTNPRQRGGNLSIVENEHFNKDVERLIKGKSSSVVQDLDYTIRAFPNHHRALNSVIRYATDPRAKSRRPLRAKPECYLQRAVSFSPKDGVARLLLGSFMHKKGKLDLALDQYVKAVKLRPKLPTIHYNLGLLYIDMKQFEKAREHARIAYSLKYPLSGLRKKLKAAGYPL